MSKTELWVSVFFVVYYAIAWWCVGRILGASGDTE